MLSNLVLLMWLADVVNVLNGICGLIGIGLVFGGTLAYAVFGLDVDDLGVQDIARAKQIVKRCACVGVVTLAVFTVLPSKTVVYAYAGAYATEQLAGKAITNERLDKILKLVDTKLDKALKE